MSAQPRKPCVFFDRDGIANVAPPPNEYYVLSPERLFVEPAFLECLRIAHEYGYVSVIVTNQKCVHRGLITMEGIDAIHDTLRTAVTQAGLELLDIYACPHGDGHPDRKPNPGMLLRAASDHNLDLTRSWMIGDSDRDIQAGKAAGCAINVFVNAHKQSQLADHCLPGMQALPDYLCIHLPRVA
ncbi:MAG: HAD-IIIA family hydrolase [Verrucomicrobia bacterium]|nr:HAD-IIIA family hydrolase [Verrucomicrobiota bacterium]